MKKITSRVLLTLITLFTVQAGFGQTVMQISGPDCNGNNHDLYADLDAGKAVILHFFMANCSSCPPPAQKIQAMANKIMTTYPGKITAYAMPFNNSVTCSYTSNWVGANSLQLYAPYDSGAVQVANYGGFGMPTVVLLGGSGANRRVMFSTLSFMDSDTTIMRDSILALFATTALNEQPAQVTNLNVFPNPASDKLNIGFELKESSNVKVDITDLQGNQAAVLTEGRMDAGTVSRSFALPEMAAGNYLVRVTLDNKSYSERLTITR